MNSSASSIIDQLGVADRYHRRLVVESCNLVDAFVELTELDMKRFQGGGTGSGKTKTSFSLDSAFKLSKLKMMETAAVTTATIPVRVDACYEGNVPLVRGFHSQFRLVGGVNIPKLIECHGDDGLTYKILVKGKDDLRQDAVLQQIFARVHEFLGRDTETRRRTLGIRTYKVVPLSPRVGIVEWVDGTVPLGSWLCSAHSRLRPSDLKPQEAREMLRVESERKSSTAADKAAVFQRLLGRFHPVFRHYFFESYAEPCKWFECRLRYVRSVATTSITGFGISGGLSLYLVIITHTHSLGHWRPPSV